MRFLIPSAAVAAFYFFSCLFPVPCNARTVTDMSGTIVHLPDHPRRIVALSPGITEIVYALGLGNRLVGTTRFGDYPPEARNLPRVGSYNSLDVERIGALGPDLCIATMDGNPQQSIRQIIDLGIPVYVGNPTNLDRTIEFIARLGEALGVPEKGRDLATAMRGKVDAVQRRVALLEKPTVFYQIMPHPIRSAGCNTFPGELIELAGGVNLAGDRTLYPRFSLEEVVVLAPQVLILSSMGGMERDSYDRWMTWTSVPAVRDGRVHVVPADTLNRPGPRLVQGLEMLVGLLHPQAEMQKTVESLP